MRKDKGRNRVLKEANVGEIFKFFGSDSHLKSYMAIIDKDGYMRALRVTKDGVPVDGDILYPDPNTPIFTPPCDHQQAFQFYIIDDEANIIPDSVRYGSDSKEQYENILKSNGDQFRVEAI